jgi:hypothetical protein
MNVYPQTGLGKESAAELCFKPGHNRILFIPIALFGMTESIEAI